MSRHLQANNSVIVSAFHSSLKHQVLIVGVIFCIVLVAMSALRAADLRRVVASEPPLSTPPSGAGNPEPVARRLLRIGFGALWVLDGVLQLQPAMPLGLPVSVMQPASTGAPSWVVHFASFGVTTWSNHPIEAAVSAVWIQIGIGVLLLGAPRGRWSRFAGAASVGWGLVVWVFGESFGGIFTPGQSWLFGAPGSALFYCLAGALLAAPERTWANPRLGRRIVAATGLFFVGMAVLQAWPGRGFWQGAGRRGGTGSLLTMVRQMADTSQPKPLSSLVSAFGRLDGAHGWGVNLFVVVTMVAIGLALCSLRPRVVRITAISGIAVCLAVWVFVDDFGFLGGVGTDPNSMLPMALFLAAGYLALVRVPTPSVVKVPARSVDEPHDKRSRWERLNPAYASQVLVAVGAVAVVMLGAAPMAFASVNPNADPILAVAVDGNPNVVNLPAPAFHLVNQWGRPVSLAGLRGRTLALTFLDPVCTSDCPTIAQEFKKADSLLGGAGGRVEFIAVVANPLYRSTTATSAFDRQEGLAGLKNWLYLTGPLPALQQVWDAYGVQVAVVGAGAMVAHSDIAYIIDANGRTREVLSANPGAGAASASSFAVLLSQQLERVMGSTSLP
jgi:cytochrome oxidase Cu insertion factor (SCO1/SenC/PrrC family)